MIEKIIEMLGKGYPNTVVANACGVSDGYISQVLSDEAVAAKVVELKMLNLQKQTARDEGYDELEDMLLDKLRAAAPMLIRPLEITKVLATVNQAKRRGSTGDNTHQAPSKVVVLNMPQFVQQRFIMNERSEVVEVGGRNLATISAKTLMHQLGVDSGEQGTVIQHGAIERMKPPPVKGVNYDSQPLSGNKPEGANAGGARNAEENAASVSFTSQRDVTISGQAANP